jgi:deoxyadenosine/deoxycytidine kinase
MAKRHGLTVAGNIGVGKTTFCQYLNEKLGWPIVPEPFAANPFLPKFYQEMERWAFHSQIFFLTARLEQALALTDSPYILDRSIFEDRVFARNLFLTKKMSLDEWATYDRLYQATTANISVPALVVYLKASTPTLLQRIYKRSRSMENSIPPEYLTALGSIYDDWAANEISARCPVLALDTEAGDFVENAAFRDQLLNQVLSKLDQS